MHSSVENIMISLLNVLLVTSCSVNVELVGFSYQYVYAKQIYTKRASSYFTEDDRPLRQIN